MKTSFIIATLALAVSVSAQTTSDDDLSAKWCKVYNDACTAASAVHCGQNFVPQNNDCVSSFVNGKCTDYQVGCICATAAGVVLNGNVAVLETTFSKTQGACSDLQRHTVPINATSPSTLPVTTGSTGAVTPTSSSSLPSGTVPPQKGNSASKTATNSFLAVAVAVGVAALAL
ncbi:hypothetical protein EMPS_07824 [Entomortierella parvispora]|uniref:Extracellular membrane protein CFEM domain-containing protein n=1 Tax=Entomortierella parvispora TaxID=205924 RepID=A0A9P3HF62_9FUNG|nr:hypothetical protein EMPS_07824 [Entomortierella parvispora]